MKKYLVGKFGEDGKLYFAPGSDNYDGVAVDKRGIHVVSIFDFLERRPDVTPIKKTHRQKRFWKMEFNDRDWLNKHFKTFLASEEG